MSAKVKDYWKKHVTIEDYEILKMNVPLESLTDEELKSIEKMLNEVRNYDNVSYSCEIVQPDGTVLRRITGILEKKGGEIKCGNVQNVVQQ